MNIPTIESLINPTLEALRELGGTARKADISRIVATKMQLSNEQLTLRYPSGSTTYFTNRMNSVRVYLLRDNLISQPQIGTWQLTEKGWTVEGNDISSFDTTEMRSRKKRAKPKPSNKVNDTQTVPKVSPLSLDELIASHSDWREQLLDTLRQLPPQRFERFFRRILEASSLRDIEFMRNDENILEGVATRGGGLMSQTRVIFRCARHNRQLPSEDITDFHREVTMSRAVQGMLIALGGFTKVAETEAKRLSTPVLDLIDGDALVSTLKDLGLGTKSEIVQVERITIDPDFFHNI